MIFHPHKTIFIHIPKAGGSSVENLLAPNISRRTENDLWMGFVSLYYNKYQTGGLQHLLAKQVQQEIDSQVFETYYKFSIVRNPWAKAVSQYVYMSSRKDLRKFINMKSSDTFLEYLKLIRLREHVQWKKQVDFILDDNGHQLVNDLFKLEEISNHLVKLTKKTGINF